MLSRQQAESRLHRDGPGKFRMTIVTDPPYEAMVKDAVNATYSAARAEMLPGCRRQQEQFAQSIAADVRRMQEQIMLNSHYGRFARGGYVGRRNPIHFDTAAEDLDRHRAHMDAAMAKAFGITAAFFNKPEEIMSRSALDRMFELHVGNVVFANPTVPPFVEPPRPTTEPEKPVDTPSAAALRPLLADRQRIRQNALDQVAGHDRNIASLEAQIASLQRDRQHKQEIAAKASAEADQVQADIDRLNAGNAEGDAAEDVVVDRL